MHYIQSGNSLLAWFLRWQGKKHSGLGAHGAVDHHLGQDSEEQTFKWSFHRMLGFPGGTVVKNPSANAGDKRDPGLIPGLRRSLGGRHGNPLEYSCLENPMDRGAWWATVHRVIKSQKRLKGLST